MKITDLINKDAIDLNVHISTKKELIRKATELMAQNGNIKDLEKYENLVLKREKEGSTGIGEGIAIPHGKGECITKPGLAAMVIPNGADFDALDGNKVNLLFLIAAPDTKDNIHLDVLSRLSTLLMDASFRENLLNAKSKDEFLKIIDNAENAKLNKNENQNNGYELLGITGCPTGIAHTYMAAEGLENAGKEMGHLIKVETQGQSGAQNVLTDEEIKRAKAIIIAADVNVDLSRFNGKKVLRTGVTDGIRRPKELIEKALNDDIPIYHGTGSEGDGNGENANSNKGGKNIYKHLMSGVTHMLPFVVGGGILIAIAFLLDDYSINPANFMLLILSGYIAMSIGDRPGLVVGFVGGAIAKAGTTFTSFSNPDEVLVSSGFLGALLAGFIGGYVILLLKKIFSFMPKSLEGIRTILIYPVAGVLLIGIIMLLINPFVSAINTGLNNFLFSLSGVNKIILGAILAGMMSVDLGGPVNKAAYTFGTGMLAEGHYEIMAAVMIGGMIAPLAIALIATFFPKKLPKKERQAGLLNYVMGLSFISEGAIPFASADPLRVLPSCVVGSAVSGAMSMAFNCTLMAPHGGILVFGFFGCGFCSFYGDYDGS